MMQLEFSKFGFFQSFSAAAFLNIFTRWAPPHELSRLVTFGFAGIYAGTALNYSLCGFLAQHYGVDSIFFVTGKVSSMILVGAICPYR